MEKAFYLRMIITMVITMGLASVGKAEEPSTCNVDGTAYFVWNIDGNGTLHVIPLEASTSHFDKSPFYKYRKQIKNVIIEDDFYCDEGFAVIGDNLFKGLDKVESIRFSDKVRVIGESAFEGCTALKEIIFPSTVKKIGRNALKGCSSLVSCLFLLLALTVLYGLIRQTGMTFHGYSELALARSTIMCLT